MTVNFNDAAIIARVRLGAARGIVAATEAVRSEAIRLVLSPPKTGRTYRRRGVEHQASAPGEAPASDTGRLAASIRTSYDLDAIVGTVTASTAYAAALEYGTPRMAPRPYMRVALANKRSDIAALVAAGVRAAMAE